jgi:4-hydroxy-tetrahydrodipicolinate synthase
MFVTPIRDGFSGVFTALVTPMRAATSDRATPAIDEAGLAALVEAQLRGGITGLVACGTTGEAAAMSAAEQARVIQVVVEAAAGRVPVLAGVGSPSTAQSIELAQAAIAAGVDGLLAVTPYYNRPPQEGLYQHFKALAQLHHPIMLYNVPARTGCDLLPDTVARLCELPAVVSLKEASGSVTRAEQLVRRLGDRLSILSGEDAINYPLYCIGARGAVSVCSNVAPRLTADIYAATVAGEHQRAAALHHRFIPLADLLFSEPNPIPAKAALALLAQHEPTVRLPLVAMSPAGQTRLRALLDELGLLG